MNNIFLIIPNTFIYLKPPLYYYIYVWGQNEIPEILSKFTFKMEKVSW